MNSIKPHSVALVFDCGATNLRVSAIDKRGKVLATQSATNEVAPDPHLPDGLIWDLNQIWPKLMGISKEVVTSVGKASIGGVGIATFGVDGALVDREGELLYPVISWQCQRTQDLLDEIPFEEFYRISGVIPHSINTVYKLLWLRRNHPDLFKRAHRFLFLPSLLVHRFTGTLQNDITTAGTSMALDLRTRRPSERLLESLGLPKTLFGPLAEPGEKAGEVSKRAAFESGIPQGTPLFFAGHDTQFALIGSGAAPGQPVLSSGTWEILMARSRNFSSTPKEMARGITTEADAVEGFYNIGQNWLASAIVEWCSKNFYHGLEGESLYQKMEKEGQQEPPGCGGLRLWPTFDQALGGVLEGLGPTTSRAQIYRALLEGLSYRLREGLEALEEVGEFAAESLLCVGGGSRNALWNQIRADVCRRPLHQVSQDQSTVLGVSLVVFTGLGVFGSLTQALSQINQESTVFCPGELSGRYDELYQAYKARKTDIFGETKSYV